MIQSPPKYFFNNIQFNPSYYSTNSVSQIDLSKKINRGGDEMKGNLSLGNKYINNLATPLTALQACNKTYCDSAIATAGGAFLPLSGGTMSGSLNMGAQILTNLPYPTSNNSDAVNKNYCDIEDNKRLRLDGSSAMTGNINCNGNNITNIGNLQSQIGSNLNLQIGSTNALQLQTTQALFSLPINISLTAGATGVDMNGTKIIDAYSLSGYSNTNFVMNYLNGATNLPKISLTSGQSIFTDGLKMNNLGIDMSGNSISNLPTGINNTDCVNKLQMDSADNLKLSLDGSNSMTGSLNMSSNSITNVPSIGAGSTISLKIATNTIMQIQALKVLMSMPIDMSGTNINSCSSLTGALNTNFIINYWGTSVLPKIILTTGKTLITDGLKISNVGIDMSGNTITNLPNGSSALDCVNKQQLDLKLNLAGGTLSNTLTFSGGGIDMGGNTITNVSNINSNGINPLILQHNSVPVVQIDASGITMQFASDINMNGGEISNASLIMPIQTSASSSYTSINSNYLNIGYTASKSYNIFINIAPTTSTRLLGTTGGVDNKLSVASGVWIITAMFNPFCTTGTPNSSRIQMFVSNVNTATAWSSFQSSSCHQMLNGNYDSNDSARMVNTFVIHLTATTDLYLWGIIDYSGGTAWGYDYAELKATRIA